MSPNLTESIAEEEALRYFEELGYSVVVAQKNEPGADREGLGEVILASRLRAAVEQINKGLPAAALDEAIRKVMVQEHPSLVQENRRNHRLLVDGVEVEYLRDGRVVGDRVRLIDFENPENNDWLVVSQFTVVDAGHNRRPDLIVFLNGIPVAVIELKNAADEDATIWTAFHQLQTYKKDLPSLFRFNEILVVSDGLEARIGSLTANRERFAPWRTIDGEALASSNLLGLEVLVRGVFEKRRLLDFIRHFVVFEEDGAEVVKKLAGYHQFHAVQQAVDATVQAARPDGDRRVGVVWHTQGSGKSLTMAFYSGKVILHPAMQNPTLVVLTDRNDLDDQLFATFSRCHELLRQKPVQAVDRADLRDKLRVNSGGVVFTTVQKFAPEEKGDRFPLLSDRRNIIVVADEAHRSQYDFIDGFARHLRDALPGASFIGFTGTPIETTDKNTRAVFGEYISVYDIQRAVEDGATVPIYYEGRLAKLELKDSERPNIDQEFEEVTEGEEEVRRERLKSKWAQLEAVVGTEKRLAVIAKDLVQHLEHRLETMEGKAMVVCMSRRICVDLYRELTKLRPEWHSDDDEKGSIKVVMTGSASDPLDWQPHIRSKGRREALATRFKNPKDELKLVLVRDMWLTGFDAPCVHSMYVDKPMRGHGLMQAIARVNRVFRDKPGGLVVDYLGLADQLKFALATYTEAGGKGSTAIDQNEAVAAMLARFEVCQAMFHGLDYQPALSAPKVLLNLLPTAQEHILKQEDGKDRFVQTVTELSRAFALAVPHEDALRVRDEVAFFQAVKAALVKRAAVDAKPEEDLDHAIRQIVSRAVAASEEVVDIFQAAGLKKPDISILSDEFLAEVRGLPQRNLALELLRKLLNDELKKRSRTNLVQSRNFSEMLERAVRSYRNRAIETAQVIEELIKLAEEMRDAQARGEKLGLSDDELAFYEALGLSNAALQFMGEPVLKAMARELTEIIRRNVTIDWTQRETARAKLRTLVKRLLRKYKYPPDRQEVAMQTVMEQAERLCETWAEDGLLAVSATVPPDSPASVIQIPTQAYQHEPAKPLMAAEPSPKLDISSKPRRRR
ncbi:type I restriction endonuclease subunit R [Corallococcus macrosporus]|uniref:Type I restriction enzyme endonuclease subunit n=1 Tax=Corallococcus macrosporus DSM 14697 TaxID=1189310 RepID=A0A250JUK6_9BACT|nr:type I restriction endonuclease subunit R [Corallococcus macrosporus]ATB47525.1 DEAD/DEAH box helicase [Corallococcus macrosporus DSM 14697]